MLSISHATTGAFIASKISNPFISIPLILLSHYLEDAIPHWDMGTGLSSGKRTRAQALFWGSLDLILALVLVFLMFRGTQQSLFGAFVGLLPDFVEAPRNFLKYEPRLLAPLNRFHNLFHHSIPRMLDGLAPQALLLTILWIFR